MMFVWFAVNFLFTGCSFDYGEESQKNPELPDIVMEDVEYVRMRDGKPVVRFQAEKARRFEEKQQMDLENFSFEQFEKDGAEVNAKGEAGSALVQLDSGDISMKSGVNITVDSEDVVISTGELDWKDDERKMTGPSGAEVDIERSDGTTFTGTGFSADARNRTWAFDGGAGGTYVHKDEDEEGEKPADESAPPVPEARPAIPAAPAKPAPQPAAPAFPGWNEK